MKLGSKPRTALSVVLALNQVNKEGATYAGLQVILGIGSKRGMVKAVRLAQEEGLVKVTQVGTGRGGLVVITLTEEAVESLKKTGIWKPEL